MLPLGKVFKGGKEHDITPELAALFRLPHFKPAIKLGSHEDETPAGGHIIGLETRDDGLWAIPEYIETGKLALEQGAYRYYSPEIVWADGWMEDPETGNRIEGPLIVGTALLHMPHLGEAAALYTVETQEGGTMEENVSVPRELYETLTGLFKRNAEPAPVPDPVTPEPAPEVAKFAALQKERDDFKAELAELKAASEKKERVDKFTAQLQKTALVDEEGNVGEGAPEMLSGMDPAVAEWVMVQFNALSARIDQSALYSELGRATQSDNASLNATDLFGIEIDKYMTAHPDVSNADAFSAVAYEQPKLWERYLNKREG